MEQANPNKRKRPNLTECARPSFNETEVKIDEKGQRKVFYLCTLCEREINGTKNSNLYSHLQHNHKEVLKKFEDSDETIEKIRAKLLLDCVELVAVNGNPFTNLLNSGLLSMLDKTLNELQQAGRGVNFTDPHLPEVKEILSLAAEKVQRKICEELRNRPLSLLVDITTKRRRSILGVSVQYITDKKQKIRSIGMLELSYSHTGEYLSKVIGELLQKFNVRSQQIITITTDNGANVLKMIRGLSSQMVTFENNASPIIPESESCDNEIVNYLENVTDYTDDQALDLLFNQIDEDGFTTEHENLLDAVLNNVQNQIVYNFVGSINGIRCAAHTLQLCIKSGLNKLERAIVNVIEICRHIAKTMRLNSTAHALKSAGISFTVPHLDVETRWCSTYIMVKIMFNSLKIDFFKSIIIYDTILIVDYLFINFQLSDILKSKQIVDFFVQKKVKLFELIAQKWKILRELVFVLEIPYNATLSLQNPHITLSDVYGIWTKMKLHLQACAAKHNFKTDLSQHLVDGLNERHDSVFNNPEMECSLFLDPRFRSVILRDNTAVERTKLNLVNLWNRLKSLYETNSTIRTPNTSSDLNFTFDEQAELNKLMNRSEHMIIEDAIDLFQPENLSSEKSVLDFWQSQKDSILYDVAMAIYSIPPTQVQIERDFSTLGHIFTERRYKLSQEHLEKILLINLNKDIFYAMKKEWLNEI